MYGNNERKITMYGDFYIRKISAEAEARRAQRAAQAAAAIADPRAELRKLIAEWTSTLPPEAREDGFVLEDIRKVIHATPQQLGLALAELNWRRTRVWKTDGPYRRRWYPPEVVEAQ
jgi:hypothetical protein